MTTNLLVATNDGIKSIPLNALPESSWQIIGGRGEGTDSAEDIVARYKDIPWLYRGVNARVNAAVAIPRSLSKGEGTDEADVGSLFPFLSDFLTYIEMFERWYILYARAYARIVRSKTNKVLAVEPMHPSTIKPIWDRQSGALVGFKRTVNQRSVDLTLDEVFYWWKTPEETELGWGVADASLALKAAGVLYYSDAHAQRLFASGAINPTILSVNENTQESDRQQMQDWVTRTLTGIKKAFSVSIVKGEIKPLVLGQDLDKLSLPQLTKVKREDIATALGVPQSLMFSSAATYATARQDKLNLYEETIKPDDRRLVAQLNRQLFKPLGYTLNSHFERMEIYQESETEKASGLTQLVNSGIIDTDEARVELAYEPRAVELPTGNQEALYEYHITTGVVTRNEARERLGLPPTDESLDDTIRKLQEQINLVQQAVNAGIPMDVAAGWVGLNVPDVAPAPAQAADTQTALRADLKRWRSVSQTRFKEGKPAKALDFSSDVIPPATQGAIRGALRRADNLADISRIFDLAWSGYP